MGQTAQAVAVDGEIIVTAQRRAENVQDVPISITVLSGAALNETGIVRFEELGTTIPNFTVSANASSDTISIRGINSDGQQGGEQSVGVYVDGVYRGRGVQSRFAFLDLQRVEVLRGPQGTLFGKNTIAGAVSITSARPTDQFEASLQGLYEFNNNEVDLRGHVSGPLADGLSARIAFLYNRLDDGWVENALTGNAMPKKRDWAVRGSVKWEPSDNVEINARYERGDLMSRGAPFDLVRVGPSLAAVQSLFNFPGLNGSLDGVTSISNSINPFASLGLPNQPAMEVDVMAVDAVSDEASIQTDIDIGGGVLTVIFTNTIAPTAASRLTATVMPEQMLKALDPAYVTPLAALLCHESSTENGSLFEVGGGWVAKLRWEQALGAMFPAGTMTAESLAARWDEVTSFEGARHPRNIQDTLQTLSQQIGMQFGLSVQ